MWYVEYLLNNPQNNQNKLNGRMFQSLLYFFIQGWIKLHWKCYNIWNIGSLLARNMQLQIRYAYALCTTMYSCGILIVHRVLDFFKELLGEAFISALIFKLLLYFFLLWRKGTRGHRMSCYMGMQSILTQNNLWYILHKNKSLSLFILWVSIHTHSLTPYKLTMWASRSIHQNNIRNYSHLDSCSFKTETRNWFIPPAKWPVWCLSTNLWKHCTMFTSTCSYCLPLLASLLHCQTSCKLSFNMSHAHTHQRCPATNAACRVKPHSWWLDHAEDFSSPSPLAVGLAHVTSPHQWAVKRESHLWDEAQRSPQASSRAIKRQQAPNGAGTRRWSIRYPGFLGDRVEQRPLANPRGTYNRSKKWSCSI